MVNDLNDLNYGIAWAVPVEWTDISAQLPPPDSSIHLWNGWASDPKAATLLAATPATFPDGLMLLTLSVQSVKPSAPPPPGEAGITSWDQPVWRQELKGDEAAPFALHLAFIAERPPYQYLFALDCAPPGEADTQQQEAFMVECRHVWNFVSSPFGLCAMPMPASEVTMAWQQVNDDWYHYAFEVPASWLLVAGTTADRLSFFSDPGVHNQPNSCPLPNGLMKLDFAVEPPGNFGSSGPNLEGFTAITVAGRPAWKRTVQGGDAMGPFATGTAVYIEGRQLWYYFGLICTPPTSANPDAQAEFAAQCEETITHILNSFEIQSE